MCDFEINDVFKDLIREEIYCFFLELDKTYS